MTIVRPDLASLASRFTCPPLTRFAPSPTGYLHLGHVVNAIYVWGVARALGGQVLLRIEDHDRIRSRPEFESALVEDLDWLGFVPRDPGGLKASGYRQRDNLDSYSHALAQLKRTRHVYACDCSRKEIGSERYAGRCRSRNLPEAEDRGIRVEMAPGVERFVDALLGSQEQSPVDQCGDLLLRDRDGHWTYQCAVTVDDERQGVTLVVRGADLLSSTGRQICLARMLGRAEPPVFLHHPILMNAAGEKLSKSSGDTGVRELRAAGVPAEDVIGRAALAVGLIDRMRSVPASRVRDLFL